MVSFFLSWVRRYFAYIYALCLVVFDHGGQTLGAAQKPFTADL